MRSKLFNVLTIVGLLCSVAIALPAGASVPDEPASAPPASAEAAPAAQAQTSSLRYMRRGDVIDVDAELRAKKDVPIEGLETLAPMARSMEIQAPYTYAVGDDVAWLYYDAYRGGIAVTAYNVVTIAQHCEVWVQNDLNYYNLDGSRNVLHPDAQDPSYVTPEKLNYIASVFDAMIYPTITGFFGPPVSMDGTQAHGPFVGRLNGDGDKIVILVSNVRDDNFYDPINNASYIAGFYWGTYEYYSGRNMITIDSKQWDRRVGDNANPAWAYLYDSTLGHEFQHLIHDDVSPNEDTWINEGMSGLAEFLGGYWFTEDLGGRAEWQTWPQNSLIQWGDQNADVPERGGAGQELLADYQIVNTFMLYTTGRIGGSYTDTAKLARQAEDGILGFNQWLSETAVSNPAAAGLTFEEIFNDFRRDMLYGGDTGGAQPRATWNAGFTGDYDSPLERSGGRSPAQANLGVLRDNLDREGYDWPGVPPFGTNFIEVCLPSAYSGTLNLPVQFDGDQTPPATDWSLLAAAEIYTPSGSVAGDVLYSGHTDLMDNFVVYGPLAVSAGDQLSFDHYYNIEEAWDYGFVQVTTDMSGMSGWTSLNMAGMTTTLDSHAHPIIKANVPGFSGFSGGWLAATHDLSAYAGQQILLAFRYATDWGGDGSDPDWPSAWAIDNVTLGSTALDLGSGRSIQAVRGGGKQFSFEFLTWDGLNVAHVYTATLNALQNGLLNLGGLPGFSQAGDRGVVMISLALEVFPDLIAGGIAPTYADYTLVGLPPSICTSDVDAWSLTHAGQARVYAGDVMTASVHVDNIGSSASITTLAPATVYAGVEVPANTTFQSATGGASYVANLQTVAASFPAVPGVYWTGEVARTSDFDVVFTVDADLQGPNYPQNAITVNAHFADSAGATLAHYTAQDSVNVVPALSLSALAPDIDPVFPGQVAPFTANVLNMSPLAKPVQLVATHPADTTFLGVTGATVVATSTTQITLTQSIAPYATSGAGLITFQWRLGPSYDFGDQVTSAMVLEDTTTSETFALSATADVDASYRIYLPIVMKNS